MKKHLRFVLMDLLLVAVVLGCSQPSSSTKTYNIGDTDPAGGIVFYDQGSVINGWRYMECAPSDQGTYSMPQTSTGVKATAIGAGKANTAAEVSIYGAGTYAQEICQNLHLNGYSDWFLPSKDEAVQMVDLVKLGLGDFPNFNNYQTSSEIDQFNTWCVYADGGAGGLTISTLKASGYVRAVREFAP